METARARLALNHSSDANSGDRHPHYEPLPHALFLVFLEFGYTNCAELRDRDTGGD